MERVTQKGERRASLRAAEMPALLPNQWLAVPSIGFTGLGWAPLISCNHAFPTWPGPRSLALYSGLQPLTHSSTQPSRLLTLQLSQAHQAPCVWLLCHSIHVT